MIANRITQDATLHTFAQGVRDEDSGDYTTDTPVDKPVKVALQQRTTREDRNGRIVSITYWTGLFRPDTELTAQDEITVPGLGRFDFEGDPWPVVKPRTGVRMFWVVNLRRVS